MHEGSTELLDGRPLALLVGNANVGKSVIFNRLTGHYAIVSNYPGTTVEITSAPFLPPQGEAVTLIDTPGINGFLPFSEDEKVTQRIVLDGNPRFLVLVADAKNLQRSLQVALQLVEIDCPLVLALNMTDEAELKGIAVDAAELAAAMGVEVVPTSATTGTGLPELKRALGRARRPPRQCLYGVTVEAAIAELAMLFDRHPISARLLAILLLSRDPLLGEWLQANYPPEVLDRAEGIVTATERIFAKPLAVVIATAREKAVSRIVARVVHPAGKSPGTLAERIGVWTRRPLTGFPVFLAVVYLMYLLVGKFAAGTLVHFLEVSIFGGFINPWARRLLAFIPLDLLRDALVGDYGLITMGLTYSLAIVLPTVGVFFFCFGFLEDSGYLPRLAIMSNRFFRHMGLNGKAVLPMVLGLGCDTMATLTARILETKKERLLVTVLLALGIPCSAQLGVILAILSALSPWAVVTVVGVIASQLFLVGWTGARVLPGEGSDFILEIPPIRLPRLSNLLLKTYLRVEWFLKEAIPLFLIGTFILFLAHRAGLIASIERLAAPLVVRWLGLPASSAIIFVMGFFRRDYGAAGLYRMFQQGAITPNQAVVSLVVITLFIPCLANFLVILKEQGWKKGLAIFAFVMSYALIVGGLLQRTLTLLRISF